MSEKDKNPKTVINVMANNVQFVGGGEQGKGEGEEADIKEIEEKGPKPPSRGGGWVFPAVIVLVMAAWCAKDGYLTPDPTGEYVRFNQIMAVVLGIIGLGLLAYELLRPRNNAPSDEKLNDNP